MLSRPYVHAQYIYYTCNIPTRPPFFSPVYGKFDLCQKIHGVRHTTREWNLLRLTECCVRIWINARNVHAWRRLLNGVQGEWQTGARTREGPCWVTDTCLMNIPLGGIDFAVDYECICVCVCLCASSSSSSLAWFVWGARSISPPKCDASSTAVARLRHVFMSKPVAIVVVVVAHLWARQRRTRDGS